MGVTGLLQNLKEIQEPASLQKYKGKTLAVDTYGWLHRGLISCAQELCQDVPTKKYVTYVMNKVAMLRHFGVEPYLVFDGAWLPTKAETAKERRVKRDDARKKADAFIKKGDRKSAWKEFMKAAGVTPEMAKSIMVELDALKVKYVVAPYEADPQMVYLEKIGLVDGILSEDSDLLIFGCRKLITKLNDQAECIEIDRNNFHLVKKIPYLPNYTDEQLRLVAMLSGCDYTKGVASIGLKTAFTLVKKYNNIERVLMALRSDGKKIDPDFLDEAHKANLAFQFQKVFNPVTQTLSMLNDYPDSMSLDLEILESCCGQTWDNEIHVQICNGKIHPNSHETLVSREQSLALLKGQSFYGKSNITSAAAVRSKSLTAKSIPLKKIGGIDSFFKPRASTLVKADTEVISKAPSSPKLSAVSAFPSSISTRTSTSTTTNDVTTIQQAVLSDDASTQANNKRSFAHRLTDIKNNAEKISPTSKKIKKYANPIGPVSKPSASKFFSYSSNSNKSQGSLETFDSSNLSGDSDIPDEFSSPVNRTSDAGSRGSDISGKLDTRNILAGIDEDDIDDGSITDNDQENEKDRDLSKLKKAIDFEISDDDDEIEESPVKAKKEPNPRLLSLREKFSMSGESRIPERQSEQVSTEVSRERLFAKKDLRSDVQETNESKYSSPLSSDDSFISNTRPPSFNTHHPSENFTLQKQSRNTVQAKAKSQSLTKTIKPQAQPRKNIDLRKFAFTRG